MVKRVRRGFTLIELLVVLAIVATLLTLALPRYSQSLDSAKVKVLAENLRVTREAIDKFYADNRRYPDALQELVEKKYLRAMPFDPVAETDSAWTLVPPQGAEKGSVGDIKSSAQGLTPEGKALSEL